MIKFCKGNIFESHCQVLVNPVNTVGVMGKGLALQFKNKYPEMYDYYHQRCLTDQFHVGDLMLYVDKSGKWILNFPTKVHWLSTSKYEYIERGLKEFVGKYKFLGITSIAFPKLGSGLGGLNWNEVKYLMTKYLQNCNIEVEIYE